MEENRVTIRPYAGTEDEAGIRACFVALQDHEHGFAPEAPTGAELVDTYLPFMLKRVLGSGGQLFVALSEGQVIGFASAVRVQRPSPDDIDVFHVEVAEISVLPNQRGNGVGARLLRAAEGFARDLGAPSLRIRVDRRNRGAHRLYAAFGFEDSIVTMAKRLA